MDKEMIKKIIDSNQDPVVPSAEHKAVNTPTPKKTNSTSAPKATAPVKEQGTVTLSDAQARLKAAMKRTEEAAQKANQTINEAKLPEPSKTLKPAKVVDVPKASKPTETATAAPVPAKAGTSDADIEQMATGPITAKAIRQATNILTTEKNHPGTVPPQWIEAAVQLLRRAKAQQNTAAAKQEPAAQTDTTEKVPVDQPQTAEAQEVVEEAAQAEVPEQVEAASPQAAVQEEVEQTVQEEAPEQTEAPEQVDAPEDIAAPVAANTQVPAPRVNKLKFGLEPILPYSIEEAINRLRINISFLGNDIRKIMVVSSEPNEGKSFVALNLWKQMAVANEKSILVDLDMRKSNMALKYQMSRADGGELKGTSQFLSGSIPPQDMILQTDLEFGDILPNVDNIVNPSMLLESQKFTELFEYMEANYRYIFVDVPPLGLVSDAELIGSRCDGAVLCVRAGVTSRSIVRKSMQQLERSGCPLLGIVLNRVGASGTGYYNKYYGKKYYSDKYYSKG